MSVPGVPVKVSTLLEMLIAFSSRDDIEIKLDKDRFRPIDIPTIFGDNTRLITVTGWQQEYSLEDSLRDSLDWWREKIMTEKGNAS